MDPLVTSALISGGSNLLSGVLGGIGGGDGSAKRFRNRQQDFAEDAFLRQTQHRVDDMRRAGLNPILAASGGVSSGSPSMAPNADSPSAAKQANTAKIAAAAENVVRMATAKNLSEDTKLKRETQKATQAQAAYTDKLNNKTDNEIENLRVQKQIYQNNVMESLYNASSARERYAGDKVEGDIDRSTLGQTIRKINRALPAAETSSRAISEIMQFWKPKKYQSMKGK